MSKQNLGDWNQESPVLWAAAREAESEWDRSLRTPETDYPGESQEAAQNPWNVLQEALLSSGSFPESRR